MLQKALIKMLLKNPAGLRNFCAESLHSQSHSLEKFL